MLLNEWIQAVNAVGPSYSKFEFKRIKSMLFDHAGVEAANKLYQSKVMDKVLTGATSRERHLQLADWVMSNKGRRKFAVMRSKAVKRLLLQHIKDTEYQALKFGEMLTLPG